MCRRKGAAAGGRTFPYQETATNQAMCRECCRGTGGRGAAQEPPALDAVLDGAARLQELVPGAVRVGGSAAAFHAGHRLSYDHDHVVAHLAARYDTVLERVLQRERARSTLAGRRRYAGRLRALRRSAGLSMRELATAAGTSAARISDYENARIAPTTDVFARLASVLELRRPDHGSPECPSATP